MSFPTPNYDLKNFDSVYEPAEDTFLLLDALQADLDLICSLNPTVSLEIGSGSGVASTFLNDILKGRGIRIASLTSDLNPAAADCTKLTAELNSAVDVSAIVTDLTRGFEPRIFGKVDILLFNPPYVPTSSEELSASIKSATVSRDSQGSDPVNRENLIINSWAGGERGRQVTDRFLPRVPGLLSQEGLFYLVAVKENDIPELLHYFPDLTGEIVIEKRAGPEHLHILRYKRYPMMILCSKCSEGSF